MYGNKSIDEAKVKWDIADLNQFQIGIVKEQRVDGQLHIKEVWVKVYSNCLSKDRMSLNSPT